MPTEKLYYVNQYQTETTAVVRACEAVKGGWEVVLDRTVFYPTGGGQPCDLGTIGSARVLDVSERAEEVVHLCDAPAAPGETVPCALDWQRRFSLMQQHSGEHLVSGIVHRRFGYDNVGFHMGKDVITIDFSGELDAQALREVEQAANAAVWADLPSTIFFPDVQTLHTLPYRSKKELTGAVRLVQFADVDLCACCGLHVARTGEIGLIKLFSTTKFHNGSRVELLCGGRALDCLNAIYAQNHEISALLSAKPEETANAVRRVSDELAAARWRTAQLENRLFAQKAEALSAQARAVLFEEAMSPDALRRYADTLLQAVDFCALFAGNDGDYKYVLAARTLDLRETVHRFNAALTGRGGGKPQFAQGAVRASRAEIEAFFENENL